MEASMCFSSLNYPENDQRSIDRGWWISRVAISLSLTTCHACRWAIPAPNKVCTVKSCTNAHSYQSFNPIKTILVSSSTGTKHTQFCFEKVHCGWNFRCYNDTRMDFKLKSSLSERLNWRSAMFPYLTPWWSLSSFWVCDDERGLLYADLWGCEQQLLSRGSENKEKTGVSHCS